MTKEQCDKEIVGKIFTDSKNVANIRASIAKLCGDTNMCTKEINDYVAAAGERVGAIAAIAISSIGVDAMELKRSLKTGDYGDDFQELKRLLLAKGYSTSDDDTFGFYTMRMVMRFQKDFGLTQDGSVGPATWALLNSQSSMLSTPWMKSMEANIGQSFITDGTPTAFNREVFSHTDITLKDRMLSGCAAGVCWALETNGFLSTHDASAISYKGFGIPCDLVYGCFVVLEHLTGDLKGHNHVAFFVSQRGNVITLLGANQNHTLGFEDFNLDLHKIVYSGIPVKAA